MRHCSSTRLASTSQPLRRVCVQPTRYGGSLENRARALLETVRAVRAAVGKDFSVSVKLNSSDFQKGGFMPEEAVQVAEWLEQEGIDLLEISGGNYESGIFEKGETAADGGLNSDQAKQSQ